MTQSANFKGLAALCPFKKQLSMNEPKELYIGSHPGVPKRGDVNELRFAVGKSKIMPSFCTKYSEVSGGYLWDYEVPK